MSDETQGTSVANKVPSISFEGSQEVAYSEDLSDLENQQRPMPKDLSTETSTSQVPLQGQEHAATSKEPVATIPLGYKATKAPKDTLYAVYKAGEYKAALPLSLLMVQSFMAGIYISMAGHVYLAVGGGVLGAALFPTGLIAVVLTSAELFTGDALVFIASYLGGRVTFYKLMRNWTVSWIMNFAGSLVWASLLAYASNSLADLGREELAVEVALRKANEPWGHIFLKAIGANFMVCVGVWQATCAEDVAGKVLGLWFPISAFVMMGFDHAIANQFLIPIGMMYGADVSIVHLLFMDLLPATLGNIVGGGGLVGAVYWYVYDSMASNKQLHVGIREGLFSKAGRKLHSTHFGRRRLAGGSSDDDHSRDLAD